MIRIEELHKSFGNNEVLKGVSLDLGKGEFLALIGRSGYGKSVLLKHLAGLMKPDRGRVLVEGNDVCNLKAKELLRFRNRLGFLFQGGALFDSMTVFENVAFPLREKTNLSHREINEKVLYELEQVGLIGAEPKYPSQISAGMLKRTAIARALIEEPEIMLIDEPTTGLDPIIGHTILNLIDSCHKRVKFTGIIVTHDLSKVFDIVDNVAMLYEGKILIYGSPDDIMTSKDPIIQQFITGSMEGPIQNHDIRKVSLHQRRDRKRVYPKWRESL